MPKAAERDKQHGGANLGFEEKLWAAADRMRGHMDPAEYKHVALGLIFLKYISDAFQERYEQLQREAPETHADPEDADEYLAENVFWVPPVARWAFLQAQAKQPEIGKLLDEAMIAIERDNPSLKGVLPKEYAPPALDKHRLGELIDIIGSIGLGDRESRSKDILGRSYEYFLSQFASAEGKKGGDFYTPRSVVRLLVEMIEPYKGRVYDPCCGSGGMFVQSEKFIAGHGGRRTDVSIFGQKSNDTTWRLAKMNLAIRGIEARLAELLRQKPKQAGDRDHLKELLRVASGGVVFTTIQKFFPEERGAKYEELSDRRNIVVIADEAHRSQYEFIDGFARHMRDALPNASFIGFTGTPIESGDHSTPQVFGEYIDKYDIQQAVEDGATVPIYYEARLVKIMLDEEAREFLDQEFEEVTEGEEVRELPQRNLALAALKRLLTDAIKSRARKNIVEARAFSALLEKAILRYQNRSLEAAQVITELIALAKDLRAANQRGEQLGLSEDELAFYDALEVNDSAVKVLGDDTLKTIARELVETVRRNTTIDWTLKESVRAKLRAIIKRLLRKHGYPPDKQEQATQTVMEQAELLAQDWVIQ